MRVTAACLVRASAHALPMAHVHGVCTLGERRKNMGSVPTLDFGALVTAAFTSANSLIPTFAAIAGIAIGFPLVLGMIGYLSGVLGKLFKARP